MSLTSYTVSQFRQPHGPVGHLAGWIMARRPSNRERNLWTLSILGVEPNQRVLEIGFGPGYAIEQLLERCPSARITGIDHSAAMVRQAGRRNRAALGRGTVRLLCLGVEGLDRLEGPFDRVFSSNAAQFWPDRVRVFRDIRSILAPGGRVVTTYLPRHPGATDEDAVRFGEALVGDMARAGLSDPRLERGPRTPVLTVSAVGWRKPQAVGAH